MEIINKLNIKIDKLVHEYELLKKENQNLRQDLYDLKNTNDELVRNNQDMLLKIDSTITLLEAKKHGR
jgi:cell division protein ZapB